MVMADRHHRKEEYVNQNDSETAIKAERDRKHHAVKFIHSKSCNAQYTRGGHSHTCPYLIRPRPGSQRGHRVTEVFRGRNRSRVTANPTDCMANMVALGVNTSLVTGSRRFLWCGHEVTAEFRRSQIVTPVAAVSMGMYGSDHPLITV